MTTSANATRAPDPDAAPPCLTPPQVHGLLNDEGEWALLDVREEGAFATGHPFWAVCAPLSHLETRLPRLVPRRNTRIVLMDACGEGLAERAARRMRGWSYSDVSLMQGGLAAWQAAGLPSYSGIFVPSKAFGEFVEHRDGTPDIDAATFRRWLDEGRDMLVLDSRPYEEFHDRSLPGGIDCPGAELVHRIFDLIEREDTTIVVNCAGRTRGIIGAQSLINAGIANPVVTLRNGLAGWHLAGEPLEHSNRRVAPAPTLQGLQRASLAAAQVARRFGVREIAMDELRRMQAESGQRTLYLFDVRLPEEYTAGHLPGARSAPGGQLVQSTDEYVGTRGARLVLCDDNGIRARMTASWLVQLGWREVFVLRDGLHAGGTALERGPEPVPNLATAAVNVEPLSVVQLQERLGDGDTVLLDLSSSLRFRQAHIPGAWFGVRARLVECLARLPPHRLLVLTSDDGSFAELAAADVRAVSGARVAVLRGGNAAWRAAGLELASGHERLTTGIDDVWYSPYLRADREQAMHAYLDWEIGLLDRVRQEAGVRFGETGGSPAPKARAEGSRAC